MALTKEIVEDKIEVLGEFKALNIRTTTVIKDDGTEITRKFHRKVLQPGDIDDSDNYTKTDVSSESTEVKGITNTLWTQSLHDAFKDHLIANKIPSKPG